MTCDTATDDLTSAPSARSSRTISRRGGSRVNYQEAEEEATDEDDLMEVDPAQAAAAEPDTGETVERVLNDRVGKVGGQSAAQGGGVPAEERGRGGGRGGGY